jgi:hypothetical protein
MAEGEGSGEKENHSPLDDIKIKRFINLLCLPLRLRCVSRASYINYVLRPDSRSSLPPPPLPLVKPSADKHVPRSF